ncbi:hypothetical protein [Mycobacterium sp.]|uniref:hypothetical protein n=1 Tax=Mycobacterium sp. TaxID=1785 RepID=UPI003C78B796
MAWEWVAPAATAAATTTVGVAGIFFTWLTGKQGRDHAETISNQRLTHERLLAKEAREQERLENAYVELLRMAERAGQWAQMVYPVFQSGQPPSTPLPSLEVQADTEALVNAFGSAEVRELLETWRSVLREVISTVAQIQWEESDPTRASQQSPRLTLESLRGQERTTREALAKQVAVELGQRTDPRTGH